MKFLALFEYERGAWWIPLNFEADSREDVPVKLTKAILDNFVDNRGGDMVFDEYDFVSERDVRVFEVNGEPMMFEPALWNTARTEAFKQLQQERETRGQEEFKQRERAELARLQEKYGDKP